MSAQMNEKLLINWFISDRTFALKFIRFIIALLINFKRTQFHPIKLTPIYLRKVDYNSLWYFDQKRFISIVKSTPIQYRNIRIMLFKKLSFIKCILYNRNTTTNHNTSWFIHIIQRIKFWGRVHIKPLSQNPSHAV